MATLFNLDNTVTHVTPANGESFTLEEMQGFVGGLIEILTLNETQEMVINEEGKVYDLDVNEFASFVARHNDILAPGDYIAGPALVGTPHEFGYDAEEDDEDEEDDGYRSELDDESDFDLDDVPDTFEDGELPW